jgi:hypothetical protein
MATPRNGAQYAIDSVTRNVTAANFVENQGTDADIIVNADYITLQADQMYLPATQILSIWANIIAFPGTGAATTLYDFNIPGAQASYPIGNLVWVDAMDGNGSAGSCLLRVDAGHVPTILASDGVHSETGVTAVVWSVAATAIQVAFTGKTVASGGAVKLTLVV